MYADVFLSPENICFWGARLLRSLAQYNVHICCRYIGGLAPQYQKAGYATACGFMERFVI